MNKREWNVFYCTPGHSQRYAEPDDNEYRAPELREVFVFDNSGSNPDRTDDGPLRVVLTEPFTVSNNTFSMSVIVERTGDRSRVMDDLEGLLPLLKKLRSRGIRMEVVSSRDARAGARALVQLAKEGVTEI